MKHFFLSLIFMSSGALAQESIMDLGTLQVDGELRQPEIQFVHLKKMEEAASKVASEALFDDLEAKLVSSEEPTGDME